MYINRLEIYNFRSHKHTVVDLSCINVLIGQNNTGKSSLLHAINFAIGFKRGMPSEDDFYAEGDNFNPKNAEPIKIILEFRETLEKRFSEKVLQVFDKAIQFDEEVSKGLDEPLKFFCLCYEFKYNKEKDKFDEERYFVDRNNQRIKPLKVSEVRREHLSFFPFFYLEALRDINKEIKSRTSFWGRIKYAIDYREKEDEIRKLIEQINELILQKDETVNRVIEKLKELEHSIRITSDALSLHAFTRRSWELLDDLNIYLKLPYADLSLPIFKHGAGTQNIMVLLIFSAYLEILLPKIIENDETTPVIGLEEPESHVHPQAQRALFCQISNKIEGQKIVSTHSPYIVEQADIYEYVLFKIKSGVTEVKKIPRYKRSFNFRHGLPVQAYENNKFLTRDEELLVRRYIQYRNAELFFSSLFILCEGDSEKIFLERITPYYTGKSTGQLGISVISCEGQTYSPFLKIANPDAFDLKWIILSDGEGITKQSLKNSIENSGYKFDDVKDRIFYLPDGFDFEKYIINYYGVDEIKKVVAQYNGHKAFEIFKKELEKKLPLKDNKYKDRTSLDDFTEEELLNIFIDEKGKPKFAEQMALYIIENRLNIPEKISELLKKAQEEVGV